MPQGSGGVMIGIRNDGSKRSPECRGVAKQLTTDERVRQTLRLNDRK